MTDAYLVDACEAVAEIYASIPGRDIGAASQMLRWLADQIEQGEPGDEHGEDGPIYE